MVAATEGKQRLAKRASHFSEKMEIPPPGVSGTGSRIGIPSQHPPDTTHLLLSDNQEWISTPSSWALA